MSFQVAYPLLAHGSPQAAPSVFNAPNMVQVDVEAAAGRAVTPVWSALALPRGVRSGSFRSLVLLNCLTEYLTFSLR